MHIQVYIKLNNIQEPISSYEIKKIELISNTKKNEIRHKECELLIS